VATTGFGESFSAGMAGGVQPTGSFDVVLSLAAGRIASDVQELPAGEIDIILVTQAGERRCKVGIKDRVRLLPRRSAQ
jgi:hypothetical protein